MEIEGLDGLEVKEFDLSSLILQFLAEATGCHSCATNKLFITGHYQRETVMICACDPVLCGNNVSRLQSQETSVHILALSLADCVILSKLEKFLTGFLIIKWENYNLPYRILVESKVEILTQIQ